MTHKEFTDRTQLQVTEQEFEAINEIYMALTLEKDAFCEDYAKHKDSALIADLGRSARVWKDYATTLEKKRKNVAEKLLEIANDTCNAVLYDLAVELVDQRTVTKMMLDHRYALQNADIDFIISKI